MATLPSHQITHKGGIAELAEKYKILAQVAPEIICREVATRTDMDLVMRLKNKSPKDTTLLSQKWRIPSQYLRTHKGKIWEIYAINEATVGEQKKLKYAKEGWTPKRKLSGRHNNKRYAKWVNAHGKHKGFYDRELRVVRQKIPMYFKSVVYDVLSRVYDKMGVPTYEKVGMLRGVGITNPENYQRNSGYQNYVEGL